MNKDQYDAYAHAMQSGVAIEMNVDAGEAAIEPKHLRVGVNAAMADHAGLVTLLMEKGFIDKAEYLKAITESMKQEKERYEAILSARTGSKVTLV